MNRDYLIDYQERETELIRDFYKKVLEGRFGPNDSYPPSDRFVKLKSPVATSAPFESIWPQIPLFGSLVICLQPCREDLFFSNFGFEIEDIDRLVDFAKDTGKIQFALGSPATTFQGLDYLDPIFKELNPPGMAPIPLDTLTSRDKIKKYMIEFYTIAEINFKKTIYEFASFQSASLETMNKIMEDYLFDYIVLKSLGYEKVIEKIEEYMLYEPDEAAKLFNIYAYYIIDPKTNTFKAINNYGLEEFRKLDFKSKN